ncbi:MAG: NUDIX domain-containing protein, partial [Nocardioidaceae bacterium]
MSTEPDPTAEWWTSTDVAAYLGVQIGTVSSYRQRQQMPPPDSTLGRTHLWHPGRIIEWHERRPRRRSSRDATAASSQLEREQLTPSEGEASSDVAEASRWIVHGRRNLYDSQWIRLDLVDIKQPGGQRFEHHAVEMPAAAMTALLDDSQTKILLLWRHRFAPNLWNWELPGGLIDGNEEPEETAARKIEE